MLGVASLGVVARAALSPGDSPASLLLGGLFLLLPVMMVAAFCLHLRSQGARWGGGLAASAVAAFCNFVLLDPQYNQDANIGLGMYMVFGAAMVLVPAALLGGFIGGLVRLERATPSAPDATLPLKPWLLPLVLPVLSTLANTWAETVAQRRAREQYPQLEQFDTDGLLLLTLFVFGLLPLLGVAALPLTLLYRQARRGAQAQPWLGAWWGVAAGLAGSLLLLSAVPRLWERAFVPLPLTAALPFAAGLLGWAWGRRLTFPTR